MRSITLPIVMTKDSMIGDKKISHTDFIDVSRAEIKEYLDSNLSFDEFFGSKGYKIFDYSASSYQPEGKIPEESFRKLAEVFVNLPDDFVKKAVDNSRDMNGEEFNKMLSERTAKDPNRKHLFFSVSPEYLEESICSDGNRYILEGVKDGQLVLATDFTIGKEPNPYYRNNIIRVEYDGNNALHNKGCEGERPLMMLPNSSKLLVVPSSEPGKVSFSVLKEPDIFGKRTTLLIDCIDKDGKFNLDQARLVDCLPTPQTQLYSPSFNVSSITSLEETKYSLGQQIPIREFDTGNISGMHFIVALDSLEQQKNKLAQIPGWSQAEYHNENLRQIMIDFDEKIDGVMDELTSRIKPLSSIIRDTLTAGAFYYEKGEKRRSLVKDFPEIEDILNRNKYGPSIGVTEDIYEETKRSLGWWVNDFKKEDGKVLIQLASCTVPLCKNAEGVCLTALQTMDLSMSPEELQNGDFSNLKIARIGIPKKEISEHDARRYKLGYEIDYEQRTGEKIIYPSDWQDSRIDDLPYLHPAFYSKETGLLPSVADMLGVHKIIRERLDDSLLPSIYADFNIPRKVYQYEDGETIDPKMEELFHFCSDKNPRPGCFLEGSNRYSEIYKSARWKISGKTSDGNIIMSAIGAPVGFPRVIDSQHEKLDEENTKLYPVKFNDHIKFLSVVDVSPLRNCGATMIISPEHIPLKILPGKYIEKEEDLNVNILEENTAGFESFEPVSLKEVKERLKCKNFSIMAVTPEELKKAKEEFGHSKQEQEIHEDNEVHETHDTSNNTHKKGILGLIKGKFDFNIGE